MPETKPKISVCLITKNEELLIRYCLESVLPIAYEIIVLDTGSTDRTKEVVGTFSLKGTPSGKTYLHETTWKDDYALAKNECMSYATGDWILFLDSDEMLPEATRNAIFPLLENYRDKNEPVVFWFMVNNFEPGNPVPVDYNLKHYLFKTGFGIHYLGLVHESLISNESEIVMVKLPFINVNHFSSPLKNNKVKYYASLSEKIIADPDYNFNIKQSNYFHLAVCYIRMGEYEKALTIQKEAYHFFKQAEKYHKSLLFITLVTEMASNLILNFDRAEEAIGFLEEAMQIRNNYPDAMFFLGLGYLSLGNFKKFIEIYSRLADILENGKFEEFVNEFSTRGKSLLPRVYLELGRTFVITGNNTRGLECLLKANHLYPGKKDILFHLIAWYALNDHLDKAIYYYLIFRKDLTEQYQETLRDAGGLPVASAEYRNIQAELLISLEKMDIWYREEWEKITKKINSLKGLPN
jgi:glycosyltransferase involved in cell wall biosynthesis